MKVGEAYELIDRLKSIKSILQSRYSAEQVINSIDLSRKIRSYNEEIEKLTDHILNMELDDSYEFNYSLFLINE